MYIAKITILYYTGKNGYPTPPKGRILMQDRIAISGLNLHHSFSNVATDQFALHCHPHFEVYYFIHGKVSYLVEGKRYEPTPHSILLMAPGTFHGVRIESCEDYERYALHFEKGLLSENREQLLLSPFYGKTGRQDIYFEGADAFHLEDYLRSLLECDDLEEQQALLSIRLEALLSQILRMNLLSRTTAATVQSRTVDQIVSYLNHSLAEPITLDSLSERFFLSKNHLNHLFKQATGTTVRNYLIHKRVAAAHDLIRQGVPAALSAERCGFHDYSAFFKAYKKIIGASPAEAIRG